MNKAESAAAEDPTPEETEEAQEVRSGEGNFTFQLPNGKTETYVGEWCIASPLPSAADGDAEGNKGDEEESAAAGGKKVRKGLGKHTYASGETYEGEWDRDLPNGIGKHTFASGAFYEGCFVDGAFQGNGAYTWLDGAVYKGEWHANKMHGKGEYRTAPGDENSNVKWEGDFINGRFDAGDGSYVDVRVDKSLPATLRGKH